MPDDEKDQQTEQTPTGFKVPVPKRHEFFGNLKRAAKPDESKAEASNPSKVHADRPDD